MGFYYFILLIGLHGLGFSYLYPLIKSQLNDWEVGEYKVWLVYARWFRVMLVIMMIVGCLGMYYVSSKSGF